MRRLTPVARPLRAVRRPAALRPLGRVHRKSGSPTPRRRRVDAGGAEPAAAGRRMGAHRRDAGLTGGDRVRRRQRVAGRAGFAVRDLGLHAALHGAARHADFARPGCGVPHGTARRVRTRWCWPCRGRRLRCTRGARVRLEVQEQWSQISVIEGTVRFSSPAAEMDLREGQTARVEPANAARFFLYREVTSDGTGPLERGAR